MICRVISMMRWAFVIVALGVCVGANATSMVPVNLAQIVENTDKAFVGQIVSVGIVQTPKGWADKVTVKVSEPVLGKVKGGDLVEWLQYRPGRDIPLPGMPEYKAGDEHLIFLAGKGVGTEFQAAYGLGQGSFRVHRNTQTGEVIVRNDFMNSSLFSGLDSAAVADAVIGQSSFGPTLSSAQRQAASGRMAAGFANSRSGGTRLESITLAAKAMAASARPSQKYAKSVGGQPAVMLTAPLNDNSP